jgi:hypothetical protein
MHNGQLADHSNAITKQIKEITSKGSKKTTESDIVRRDKLEWQGGLYVSPAGQIWMPSDNLERAVIGGAQKFRMGKEFQSAVLCASEHGYEVQHPGLRGKSLDAVYDTMSEHGERVFVLRKLVVVQKSRIMRVRPKIPAEWSISFALTYDETLVSRDQVVRAVKEAERLGLGDWRPKYGAFTSEVLKG